MFLAWVFFSSLVESKFYKERAMAKVRDPYKIFEEALKDGSGSRLKKYREKNGFLKPWFITRLAAFEFGFNNKALLDKCVTNGKPQYCYLTNGQGRPSNMSSFNKNLLAILKAECKGVRKTWAVNKHILFEGKYEDPKQFKLALYGIGYPLHLRLTGGKKKNSEYKAINVNSELERAKELLNKHENRLLIIKGDCGSGKSTLLEHLYRHYETSESMHSLVKIDVSRFSSAEEMFCVFRAELQEKLKVEIDSENKLQSKLEGMDTLNALAVLLTFRKKWLFFLDTDASFYQVRDRRFSELVRGMNTIHIVRNLMSINGLVDSSVKIVMSTQDFEFALPQSIDMVCDGSINYEVFENTCFSGMEFKLDTISPSSRPIYQLLLFNRILGDAWFKEYQGFDRNRIIEAALEEVMYGDFDNFLHNFIKSSLLNNKYYCLLLCCIPEDDIRRQSLQFILLSYVFREETATTKEKRDVEKEVNEFLQNSGELFELYSKTENGEDVEYVRVHPYVRKATLTCCEPSVLATLYGHASIFAKRKADLEKDKITSRNKNSNTVSSAALPDFLRIQAQSIKFGIRNGGTLVQPQEIWKQLKYILRELVKLDGMPAIELRYSLIIEFIYGQTDEAKIGLYSNAPPTISKKLLRILRNDIGALLSEVLTVTQQLGMHDSTLNICEQINAGLIDYDKKSETSGDTLKAKCIESYYYVANRTGKFVDAQNRVQEILPERKVRYSNLLGCIPDDKFEVLVKLYQSKYLDSLTKSLMVANSIGDIESAAAVLEQLTDELLGAPREHVIDLVELKAKLQKALPLLSIEHLNNVQVMAVDSMFSKELTAQQKRESLAKLQVWQNFEKDSADSREFNNKDFQKLREVQRDGTHHLEEKTVTSKLTIGEIPVYNSLVPCVEAIRLLIRNECNSSKLLNAEHVLGLFKRLFLANYPFRKLKIRENAFHMLYGLMGHVAIFTSELRNKKKLSFYKLGKYELFRKELLLLIWHRSLSIPWQNDVISELIRLELTVVFVSIKSSHRCKLSKDRLPILRGRLKWIYYYIENLYIEAKQRSDVRSIATSLTFKALWKQLIDLDVHNLVAQDIEVSLEECFLGLKSLALKARYRYREPELEILQRKECLLDHIWV